MHYLLVMIKHNQTTLGTEGKDLELKKPIIADLMKIQFRSISKPYQNLGI